MSQQTWEETVLRETVCNFPKYRGQTWYDVCARDADYAEWILGNIEDLNEDLKDALTWGIHNVPMRL
jgi:hypothetical protein